MANTGAGSSAVPGSSYVSSVSGPPQCPVMFEVSRGWTPVKEHLALMVERLKDCVFDLLAAFAELLAATFALSDALVAATSAACFGDSSRGLALASFGLSLAVVVRWEMGGLLQGPDCLQPYQGKLAALMAALMGAATCLAALLAAKRVAAITVRLVSACFTGLRWKLLAGKVKEKLLSGWVPCSPWTRVMKVQSDSISGSRVLCTCVPLRHQRVYYHCCACHGPLEGLHHRVPPGTYVVG